MPFISLNTKRISRSIDRMDALVQGYEFSGSINGLKFDHTLIPIFSDRTIANGLEVGDLRVDDDCEILLPQNELNTNYHQNYIDDNDNDNPDDLSPSFGATNLHEEGDFSDATLKYISQMLMEEEDLEYKTGMFQDCSALEAAEKSFYDLIGERYPPTPLENESVISVLSPNSSSPDDDFVKTIGSFPESGHVCSMVQEFCSLNSGLFDVVDGSIDSQILPQFGKEDSNEVLNCVCGTDKVESCQPSNGFRLKKNHFREDNDCLEANRSSKQIASSIDDSDVQSNMYDQVLLCHGFHPNMQPDSNCVSDDDSPKQNSLSKGTRPGRPKGSNKKQGKKEVVDLRTLLTQCSHNVASSDTRATTDLLKRIRKHSSPHGDGIERMAYFFANAIELRLAGTGTYTSLATTRISAAQILKGYKAYVTACPFKKLTNFYANRSIARLAKNTDRLHIIDFGILYGFQWPCLIQRLSARAGGPPKLKITGIEPPQPGLRPSERVEETGKRLRNYCERFNVPFEYHTVTKKWETITLEDLKIEKEELLVVNCLYRLRNVNDETVVPSSPRNVVLKLIRSINPDLFVHGVVNGTFNAPFFVTRFREALFHFSSLFDMFDATLPREDEARMLFEQEVFGKDIMNIIACEGTERVERPETYKQWQVRNQRAGLVQLPLQKEIVKDVMNKVTNGYHRDFVVDVDGNWMLQGWKGRIIYAISCWKPAKVISL
ncbi:scarecrow-like protein 11 [Impatiens glandulifera]|uniref:scarecrow-like protein 11 n=1 Tax=Impatiens glandulifera TaxID=253017 RepID=UPI001FB183D8|nr:scarecrow-like protein 11 [Impatiens glandulifera]